MPATTLTQVGDHVRRKRAERAVAGVFEVDDIGAGGERQFGLGGIAYAGEEQGHGILAVVIAGIDRANQ